MFRSYYLLISLWLLGSRLFTCCRLPPVFVTGSRVTNRLERGMERLTEHEARILDVDQG